MTKLSDAVSASNLDSYELARRSNVSEKRLNGYLSGRHSFSRAPLEDAVAIANALGGRIERLHGRCGGGRRGGKTG